MIKIIIAAILCVAVQGHAQTLKVTKVKGNRAIVEVVKGKVSNGQVIDAGGGSGDELGLPGESHAGGGATAHSGPRPNYVGAIGSFSTTKAPGSSSSTTSISANLEYGWNPGNQMEYGGLVSFGSVSGGAGGSSTSFAGGGRFDYDLFSPNKAPLESVYSVGVVGTYGQASAGGGSSVSQITVFPMASWKYFILKTPTCVRVDAGMKFVQSSGGSGSSSSSSDSNPAVNLGLFSYF